MAYIINDGCIMCDACLEKCPKNAISAGDPKYCIDLDICDECGNCAEICPTEACVPIG